MIGETVERQIHGWQLGMASILLSVVLGTADFFMEHHHLFLCALAPFALGIALLATRKRPLILHFSEDGIEVRSAGEQFVPYDRMEALRFREKERQNDNRSFSFVVIHSEGTLDIPGSLNVPSSEVYQFLSDQLPSEDELSLPSALKPYRQKCEREFGAERVWSYRALPVPKPSRNWFWLVFFCSFTALGMVWAGAGAEGKQYEPWKAIGGLSIFGGLFGVLVCTMILSQKKRDRSLQGGGLVIAPIGFALVQGELNGQMRWDEVKHIEFRRPADVIRISFAGGQTVLKDVYNRSLRDIHNRLLDYWKGPDR